MRSGARRAPLKRWSVCPRTGYGIGVFCVMRRHEIIRRHVPGSI
jgi:hypothetical protein